LFLYYPGISPRRIDAPATLIDLAPTILDLLGLPPLPGAEGRSFAPLLAGTPPDEAPVFSEWRSRRAVARGRLRLLCDGETRSCELFDIVAAPMERHDLSASHPDEVASLLGDLDAFIQDQGRPPNGGFVWPEAIAHAGLGDRSYLPKVRPYLSDKDPKI